MNLFWRFQKCLFCGEQLKNFREIVSHHRWKLHLDCENKIKELKTGKPWNYESAMYRQMYYIYLNSKDTVEETLVFQ